MEIEKTRTLLEKQKEEERQAIEEKLKTAATIRDELIKSKLERLKEHVRTILFECVCFFVCHNMTIDILS